MSDEQHDPHEFLATTVIPQYFYSVLDLVETGDRMAIVGFHFTKLNAEKKEPIKGKVDINNNIKILDLKERDLNIGNASDKGLNFRFEFTSVYTPAVGGIVLEGEILFVADAKKQAEILAEWKKAKTVPKDTMTEIMNNVLMRSNVQALVMARDVSLPPPIPLPKIKKGK